MDDLFDTPTMMKILLEQGDDVGAEEIRRKLAREIERILSPREHETPVLEVNRQEQEPYLQVLERWLSALQEKR